MHIQEHIITTIPVFEIKDTFEKVLDFFQDTTYSHVAIVEEGRFLGVFSENDAEALLPGTKIEEFRYGLLTFFRKATYCFKAFLFAVKPIGLIY